MLSTTERDYLTKHFILRSDYEEINEDKHILRGENNNLQQQLNNAKEAEEYESKHHHLLRDEYGKLKEDMNKVKDEFKKKLWKITELQNEIYEHERREREYKNNIADFTLQIADLSKEINELQKENDKIKANVEGIHSVSSTDTEIVKSIQHQIECLRNISQKYITYDDHDEHLLEMCTSLENLKNSTADILQELKPEQASPAVLLENLKPNILVEWADIIPDAKTEEESEDAFANVNVHKHLPHKPKHPKSASHHRERKRVVILETELSELKNRLKKIEHEKNEQSLALLNKEKHLIEDQRQITALRKMLRDLKSQRQSRGSSAETVGSPCLGSSNQIKIPPIKPANEDRKLAWNKNQLEETTISLPKTFYNVKTLVVQNQKQLNENTKFTKKGGKRALSLDLDTNFSLNKR